MLSLSAQQSSTIKPSGSGDFFFLLRVGEVINYCFNFSNRQICLFRLFTSLYVNFGSCVFQGISSFYLSYQICRHRVVCIFLIIIFMSVGLVEMTPVLSDIDNLCVLCFFLVSLAQRFINFIDLLKEATFGFVEFFALNFIDFLFYFTLFLFFCLLQPYLSCYSFLKQQMVDF